MKKMKEINQFCITFLHVMMEGRAIHEVEVKHIFGAAVQGQ